MHLCEKSVVKVDIDRCLGTGSVPMIYLNEKEVISFKLNRVCRQLLKGTADKSSLFWSSLWSNFCVLAIVPCFLPLPDPEGKKFSILLFYIGNWYRT